MPELPEVETAMQGVRPHLVGHAIRHVQIFDSRLMSAEDAQALAQHRIEDMTRRGKWIICHLDNSCVLLLHLRMTGSLLWNENEVDIMKHERGRLVMDHGIMSLVDPRTFGTWQYMSEAAVKEKLDNTLSKEPIDKTYTGTYLRSRLKQSHRPIKTSILDQKIAAGMGNIYVDEALWQTKIHPLTTANKLSPKQDEALAQAMREGLLMGLEHGGSSIRDYVRSDGSEGSHQDYLNAYGKTGKPCPRCQTPIARISVGGRGTHFCPHCQLEEN